MNIFDNSLYLEFEYLDDVKAQIRDLQKKEKEIRERIDQKLQDVDASEKLVIGHLNHADDTYRGEDPLFSVNYTTTERRSLNRDKLLELGVGIQTIQQATDVTESRRLTFKKTEPTYTIQV